MQRFKGSKTLKPYSAKLAEFTIIIITGSNL